MRVKICGVCRPEDGALAFESGADYLGVVLSPGFSRSRTRAEAAAIYEAAGTIGRAGVFVDATLEELKETAAALSLAVVQLSGVESPELGRGLRAGRAAAGIGPQVWKVLRPTSPEGLLEAAAAWADAADALLLDGHKGGSGTRFDWDAVAGVRAQLPPLPLVVAGGLNAANVGAAVRLFRPDVVDVSSGVEVTLGQKSPASVRAFVAAARDAARAASS